mmetsp:Transcript_50129/g.114994  ORF Transcript_50129/g.114994 Transcript_50129/m.114994 type:complete len:219 (-) Transcript_50129:33-689(-)
MRSSRDRSKSRASSTRTSSVPARWSGGGPSTGCCGARRNGYASWTRARTSRGSSERTCTTGSSSRLRSSKGPFRPAVPPHVRPTSFTSGRFRRVCAPRRGHTLPEAPRRVLDALPRGLFRHLRGSHGLVQPTSSRRCGGRRTSNCSRCSSLRPRWKRGARRRLSEWPTRPSGGGWTRSLGTSAQRPLRRSSALPPRTRVSLCGEWRRSDCSSPCSLYL